MKIKEMMRGVLMTLNESSVFIAEMANFLADVTELPANIVLWTEPQPAILPHDKYRMKVYKDRIHCSTFSISKFPDIYWEIKKKKLRLDSKEKTAAARTISEFSSLFIQYIDGTLTAPDVKYEIKKLKGA